MKRTKSIFFSSSFPSIACCYQYYLFLLLLCVPFLSSCSHVLVSPTDKIKSNLHSRITLTDKQKIRSDGFEIKTDVVEINENGKHLSIPRTDVNKIETIERWPIAGKMAGIGAGVGAGVGVYTIATASADVVGWTVIAFPVMVATASVVSGVMGFMIGDRTYYGLNPLDQTRQTQYTASLFQKTQKNTEEKFPVWSGYHFGLNFGGAKAYYPPLGKNIESVGQARSATPFIMKVEMGKWVSPKTIWGGNIMLTGSGSGNNTYFENRGLFSVGPQVTYFPNRYGLYYKGSVAYGVYFESIEDITKLDSAGLGEVVYEADYSALGTNGSIGYAFTLYKHLNLSAELGGHAYYVSGKKPVGMVSALFGVHWY